MRILLTGGTGFIGSALQAALQEGGHEMLVLTRQTLSDTAAVRYIRSLDEIAATSRVDAVINLAGASLAGRRWNDTYRREIVASRLDTTRDVVELCARLREPPAVLLSGSAVGYYGHHGDEKLAEDGAVNPGFAQRLCEDWENAALAAQGHGVRVCLLRLGVVLDAGDSALAQMARSFRFGVASWAGDGRQWMSWVHRADVVRAGLFLMMREDLEGPFNITAPEPVTGRQLAEALDEHFGTLLKMGVPGPAMRLLMGQVADELLLNGQRVVPAALAAAGFSFDYPDIASALRAIYHGD